MSTFLSCLSLLKTLILGRRQVRLPAIQYSSPITFPVLYEDEDDMPRSQDATVNRMVAAARGLLKADTKLHPRSRAVLLQMKALVGSFDQQQCAQAQALLLQEFPGR
jgi:hypothetical protein